MDLWIEKWGIWAIIVGRAVPVVMFDPISYAAGISNVKWKMYNLATFIGSIPRSIFYAFIGYQMVRVSGSFSIPKSILYDLFNFPVFILSKFDITTLTPTQLDTAAGNFNLIFYIIFSVLILMFVATTIFSTRIQKKRELTQTTESKSEGTKNEDVVVDEDIQEESSS